MQGKSKASTSRFVAEMCRQSYYQFVLEFWSTIAAEKLQESWYIRKLCDELQVLSERVFRDEYKEYDLIWNCPPGTSKSSIVSILWQPWIWSRMPSARFISGSYSERLALDLSRKSRDVVLSDKYQSLFPEIQLRDDQNTKGYFANKHGGIRYAVGVGGSVIGMHAHFIAVDDPIDPQGALSDLVLADANAWMTETLSRRKVHLLLTPTVLIMQRLHQDDPTGNALERGIRIRHCSLPCDTTGDILPKEFSEFYEDGLLDPKRLPQPALDDAFKELGDAGYAGQYLQSPVPRGGSLFKVDRLQYRHSAPRKWKRGPVRYWDKACLVAGTQIQTAEGSVPIEEVHVGSFVLTRNGWREVEWAGLTKETNEIVSILFSDGTVVSGTPDHRIWTENQGWIPLVAACDFNYNQVVTLQEDLQWGEECNLAQRFRLLGESDTREGRGRNTSRLCEETRQRQSTKLCGSSIGEKFPMAMMFTTLTGTLATTRLETCGASHTELICESIGRNGRLTRVEKWCREWLRGRRLLLERQFSKRTDKSRQGRFPLERLPASDVVGNIYGRLGTHDPVIALPFAKRGRVPVFDLSVSEDHEFFANGVLVHNSTSKGGAFSVGTKMAVDEEDHIWILDIVRVQMDSGQRERLILQTAKQDGKGVKQWIEQEPAGSGKESAEGTVKRVTLAGYRCQAEKPSGDKELRADPLSVQVNMGNVILLEAPWNATLVAEMRFFPRSKYKDQIDACSGGFNVLAKSRLRIGAM